MKLVSKRDISWFKTISDKVRNYLMEHGRVNTKDEFDKKIKEFATKTTAKYDERIDFNKSCTLLTHKEMQVLKEMVKLFCVEVGYKLDNAD